MQLGFLEMTAYLSKDRGVAGEGRGHRRGDWVMGGGIVQSHEIHHNWRTSDAFGVNVSKECGTVTLTVWPFIAHSAAWILIPDWYGIIYSTPVLGRYNADSEFKCWKSYPLHLRTQSRILAFSTKPKTP